MRKYEHSGRLARVTVTLPVELARRADAEARRLDRSRSWVLAEALRRLLAAQTTPARSVQLVAEPTPPPYVVSAGLGEQRLSLLAADLGLTPEQRVHDAEETVEMALRLHRPPKVAQVLAFAAYEDYLAWKRRDVL